MAPATKEAYKLMHDGSLAMAEIEHNGIRVDVGYLEGAIANADREIKEIGAVLKRDKIYREWRKKFGARTNLGSRVQLADVLFKVLGIESKAVTDTGRAKVDKAVLADIDVPFVKSYIRAEELKKARAVLEGIGRETCNGFLHPFFNLNTTVTYRSSSAGPNFQNMPIRNPEIGGIIRRCFVPRRGRRLVEMDYSAIEVRIAACYHKDPVMIDYIKDETKDLHRDMAAECFMLKPKQVEKQVRYVGKNLFVFPQFYGDFYGHCAVGMWGAIEKHKLSVNGKSLKDHLRSKGIEELGDAEESWDTTPGTFLHHVRMVEERFWSRLKVYAEWKDVWYQKYLRRGWFRTLTGFLESGFMGRNDVINHPVQGSAFHCLLWSVIEVLRVVRKRKMQAKVVAQIHDSKMADVPEAEYDDYVGEATEIMTSRILKNFPWIIVPLKVEVESSSKNWFDKHEDKE